MKTFVVIFRQGQPLSEADKQRRSQETTQWARTYLDAGNKLEARILTPEGGAEGVPVSALLFLEARDRAEAVRIAESHPAIPYGSTVEIREWTTPAVAAGQKV